jgi:hypothetical protein
MIKTLKNNFEKLLLAIMLLVLAATAVMLYLRAGQIAHQLQAPRIVEVKGQVKPVDAAKYDLYFEELNNPVQWRPGEHEHRLFIPPKMYWDASAGGLVIEGQELDTNKNGIPDPWETRYGLDIGKNEAESASAADVFTNREEYLAGTDPTDSLSHPSYAAKLRTVKCEEHPVAIQFHGLDTVAGGQTKILLSDPATRESHYVQKGETWRGYKVLDYERNDVGTAIAITVQEPGGTVVRLRNGETKITAIKNATLRIFRETVEVSEGSKITIREEEFTVKRIDTANHKVIIEDAAGRDYEIPQE